VKLLGGGLLLTLAAPAMSACEGITTTLDAVLEGKRTVIDAAGREVTIPTANQLERIFFMNVAGQVYCFTMAPDLFAGSGLKFTPQELEYLPASTRDLPYLGTISGGESINREMLMTADVQIVFAVSGSALTTTDIEAAESLQRSTSIPCLCLDGSYDKVGDCYRLLGDVLGLEARAEKLAGYCADIAARVEAAVAEVPADKRVRLYYAEGPEGLHTEPSDSPHALAFKLAGAENVAEVPAVFDTGLSSVSLEQVMAWNPEVIVAWSHIIRGGADEDIRSSKRWESIQALRDGRVYTMPNAPFAWCDRPPGVNRFLGVQWLANMLYPDQYAVDMVEVVKDFYKEFYWFEVTDEQARSLLGNSYPPYRR
jgi:iron complex transport system substrate-binding protein